MKYLVPLFITLFSLSSFAGRESHGLLPAKYTCDLEKAGGSDKPIHIAFSLQTQLIVGARVSFELNPEVVLSCIDLSPLTGITEKKQLTVICYSTAGDGVEFHLFESAEDSEVIINSSGNETIDTWQGRVVPCL